ncbi:MAG: GAF domain-containing protein [Cloacibacillus porcorum]|nr:GAF domain-containing protein [Cloacibacillus porcorum]
MKNGKSGVPPVFRPRRFWTSVLWLVFLAAGAAFSCIFGVFAFFTAVLVAVFIGLNEFGRWPYKTNLVICAGTAVVVAVAGIFTWMEITSLFVLFFTMSAYMFYFRDRTSRLIPALETFAASLAKAPDFDSIIENAWRGMQEMAPDAAVFVVLADIEGCLYIPDHFGQPGRALKRIGGTLWTLFASLRSINIPRVSTGRDQPLDRDALSLISAPITARAEKLGVLQLEAGTAGAFSEEDVTKLSLAAMIIGQELYMFEASEAAEAEDGVDDPD